MCTNYHPASRELLDSGAFGDVRETRIPFKPEVFPNDPAPIIRRAVDSSGAGIDRECLPARFGLVPFWAKDDQVTKLGRMAYNARTETVSSKPMFRQAWRRAQFCLIPAHWFYEPNWESGRAVRWRIEMASRDPFAIGGLWEHHGEGDKAFASFTMLTINADQHPLMNQFHRPGDEKRMPVIVPASHWQAWLDTRTEDAPAFFAPFPAEEMTARPEPLPPRSGRVKPTADVSPAQPEGQAALF